ncbi:hypothetical protein [Psychrobacillus sp. FSL K6-1464]|uniref:hypothetical protein n=1 Tax=Psychrobacillus sp. FSL K6-1464 TaxID=2921545 RepID=UPI0030F8319D
MNTQVKRNCNWTMYEDAPAELLELLPMHKFEQYGFAESMKLQEEATELGWVWVDKGYYNRVFQHESLPGLLLKIYGVEHMSELYNLENATVQEHEVLDVLKDVPGVPKLFASFNYGCVVEFIKGDLLEHACSAYLKENQKSIEENLFEFSNSCIERGLVPNDMHGENIILREDIPYCIDYNRFTPVARFHLANRNGVSRDTWIDFVSNDWQYVFLKRRAFAG